jgi:hypothetical protein
VAQGEFCELVRKYNESVLIRLAEPLSGWVR